MSHSDSFLNYITDIVEASIIEDLGSLNGTDVTAQLVQEHVTATALLITREEAIICGIPFAEKTIEKIDATLSVNWKVKEGERITPNSVLLELKGNARSILTAERTIMNFLQTLSSTATQTAHYVSQLKGTQCKLLDTRKTIPGLRLAQKYAVKVGGGENHRIGLFDAFLIKENHIATSGGISQAVKAGRKLNPNIKLEVEVETFEELHEALDAQCDIIMLDNFDNDMLKKAVEINNAHSTPIKLEASGNVSLESIKEKALTGVDYISVGALTKHVHAIDLSMRVTLNEKQN